ncbi:MAG: ATPase, T2SS/T4P/T4SS family [bacterium]
MPKFVRKNIGAKLVDQGLISRDQLKEALAEHHKTGIILRKILVDMKLIDEDALLSFLSNLLDINYVTDLNKISIDKNALLKLSEDKARLYISIPISLNNNILIIAMFDPIDVFTIDDLSKLTGCKIQPIFAKENDIKVTIDKNYVSTTSLADALADVTKDDISVETEETVEKEKNTDPILSLEEQAPIIKLVNTILVQAVKSGASDIHIGPEEDRVRVRFRIDGVLKEAMKIPKYFHALLVSRIKVMGNMDIADKRIPQDGRIKIKTENRDIDVRVSTSPTLFGEMVIMRLLDKGRAFTQLESLGLETMVLKNLQELIQTPYGMILVTGPTGSGKTTTLYTILQRINSPEKNIISIEDPVEYSLAGINQIPINQKAGVTFASILRSVVRQDPDVIMIGEMRDLETAEVSIRAALTGHLVLSTLHTNDAPGVVTRLIDIGIPPYLVASSVTACLAQRLLRKLCPRCRQPVKITKQEILSLNLQDEDMKEDIIFKPNPTGCDECNHMGYKGRIGVFELMILSENIRQLIHSNSSTDIIRKKARKEGMTTLLEDGIIKVKKGISSVDEFLRVIKV